jgi:hypothetical protein
MGYTRIWHCSVHVVLGRSCSCSSSDKRWVKYSTSCGSIRGCVRHLYNTDWRDQRCERLMHVYTRLFLLHVCRYVLIHVSLALCRAAAKTHCVRSDVIADGGIDSFQLSTCYKLYIRASSRHSTMNLKPVIMIYQS